MTDKTAGQRLISAAKEALDKVKAAPPTPDDLVALLWASDEANALTNEAARRIETLTAEVARVTGERDELAVKLDAVVTGDWSTARLVRFENGQFDFAGGPVAFIAEYMSQVMEAEDGYHNNMEVRVDHPKAGPMVLTLQRVMGKTPADQRKEAVARAEKAEQLVATLEAERDAAVAEMTIIRDVILNNTKEAPPPHTVTMPDGTVHTGPLVDLWHSINALLVKRIDATIAKIKEGKL